MCLRHRIMVYVRCGTIGLMPQQSACTKYHLSNLRGLAISLITLADSYSLDSP